MLSVRPQTHNLWILGLSVLQHFMAPIHNDLPILQCQMKFKIGLAIPPCNVFAPLTSNTGFHKARSNCFVSMFLVGNNREKDEK